jgi:hypothetical protein
MSGYDGGQLVPPKVERKTTAALELCLTGRSVA